MKTDIYFDIETGPLSEELLAKIRPPANLKKVKNIKLFGQPFDPMTVKVAHLKDPIKIEKKIDDARAKYPAEQEKIAEDIAEAEQQHIEDFAEKAALDECRGEVLAIGYFGNHQLIHGDGMSEPEMLINFWDKFKVCTESDYLRKMVGFNIFGFDLPFLINRSRIHGLIIPPSVIKKNRYWHDSFIDLAEVWNLGRYGKYKSLDEICISSKLGEKLDGISGADFHKLWANDRDKAKEYLSRDLLLTKQLAERIMPDVE